MNKLPDIPSPGALFAFSGLDGNVDFNAQIVGSLMEEDYGFGVVITFPLEMGLWCEGRRNRPYRVTERTLLSDAVRYCIKKDNKACTIIFLMHDDRTVLGCTTPDFPVYIKDSRWGQTMSQQNAVTLINDDGQYAALIEHRSHDLIRFSFSVSLQSTEQAVAQSMAALAVDINEAFQKKTAFFDTLPRPKTENPLLCRCYYKAFSVLKSMIYSPCDEIPFHWTTPDRMPHRQMWLWDSAFHAFGIQYLGPILAREAVEAVLHFQKDDGFIPCRMWPGESFDLITQPPVLSWTAMTLFERSGDTDFLSRIFLRLSSGLFTGYCTIEGWGIHWAGKYGKHFRTRQRRRMNPAETIVRDLIRTNRWNRLI